MRSLVSLLMLGVLLFAGCAEDPAPAAPEGPRQSVAAEPVVAKPEPFATDLQVYGWALGPDGELYAPVTSMGFTGAGEGALTEVRVDVTWLPPTALPVRVCWSRVLGGGMTEEIPEIPCVEGTSEVHIVWSNATAGVPAIAARAFTVTYSSATPQVLGAVTQHAEGIVVR